MQTHSREFVARIEAKTELGLLWMMAKGEQ